MPFLHEMLQTYEDGEIINKVLIWIGNLASEEKYKNLIFQTNFFARLKLLSQNKNLSFKYISDIVWVIYWFSNYTLPYRKLKIIISILSEFIQSNENA